MSDGTPLVRSAKKDARSWLLKSWQARVRKYKQLPPAAFDAVYDDSEVYVVCDSTHPNIFIAGAVVSSDGEMVHFLHAKGLFRSRRYEEVLLDVVSPNTKIYSTFYDRLLIARPDACYVPFWKQAKYEVR